MRAVVVSMVGLGVCRNVRGVGSLEMSSLIGYVVNQRTIVSPACRYFQEHFAPSFKFLGFSCQMVSSGGTQ